MTYKIPRLSLDDPQFKEELHDYIKMIVKEELKKSKKHKKDKKDDDSIK